MKLSLDFIDTLHTARAYSGETSTTMFNVHHFSLFMLFSTSSEAVSFSQAFPFASFPKYFVQRTLRASRPNPTEPFLHLLEQNHRIVPSFFTYMAPVPGGNSFPQKEHSLSLGTGNPLSSSEFLGFPFGFPQQENVVGSHRAFHVSCYDASFVSSFKHSNSDLRDLTGGSCSTNHLNDFGGN